LKSLINKLFSFVLCFLLMSQTAFATNQIHHHSLMGSHGMVLFGDQQKGFYASHLPLYFSPHDYQIIYKIEVSDNVDLSSALNEGMVTVLPDKFDLTRLLNHEQFSVQTQFFQGHFERGGKPLVKAQIVFDKPVFIRQVDPKFKRHVSLYYLEQVSKDWGLAIHRIQASPSFDVIGWVSRKEQPSVFQQLESSNMMECQKPGSLQHNEIKQQLTRCGLAHPVYLETRDFQ